MVGTVHGRRAVAVLGDIRHGTMDSTEGMEMTELGANINWETALVNAWTCLGVAHDAATRPGGGGELVMQRAVLASQTAHGWLRAVELMTTTGKEES